MYTLFHILVVNSFKRNSLNSTQEFKKLPLGVFCFAGHLISTLNVQISDRPMREEDYYED